MSNNRYKQDFHIPKEVGIKCREILSRYTRYKYKKHKFSARDDLYSEMSSYIIVWINSILKSWGIFEDPNEILSVSWFAFVYCLDNYKKEYTNVEGYFYTYVRYFLLSHYAKKENVHISIDELKDVLSEFPTLENQHFERLLTLYQFRDVISSKCLPIWDDAMNCLGDKGSKYKYDIPHRFSKTAYYATRRSFVNIIKIILGMKIVQEDRK